VRQFLLRFHAVKVSTGGVKRVLRDAGVLAAPPPERKVRRAPPAVQSFERAKPMELWQTDITSFVLGRHRERAYLTVFLDDCSRYVVSFALHLQQKSELVIEALKDGIARFGKPREILTDQGRQYFAWRGKSSCAWKGSSTSSRARTIRRRSANASGCGRR
jgi:transposase InsO family protein